MGLSCGETREPGSCRKISQNDTGFLACSAEARWYSVRGRISFTFSDAPCYKLFLWLTPNSKLRKTSGEIKIEQLEDLEGRVLAVALEVDKTAMLEW